MLEQDCQLLASLAPGPYKILIRGATIIAMDGNVGNFPKGDILIADGSNAAIGLHLRADGAEVINAAEMIAIPGMLDTHHHSWEWPAAQHQPQCGNARGLLQRHAFLVCQTPPAARHLRGRSAHYIGLHQCRHRNLNRQLPQQPNRGALRAAVETLLNGGIRAMHASGAPVSSVWDQAHWPGNLARLQAKYFTNHFYLQGGMGHSQHLDGHQHMAAPANAVQLLEAAKIDGAACVRLDERIGSLTPLVLTCTGDLNLYQLMISGLVVMVFGGRVSKALPG